MSDLSFHIRQFVPESEGADLEHRTALLKARDYASMLRSRVTSWQALDLAAAAHETAGAFIYADVPADRLAIAVSYCRNLVQAAMLADHLEAEGAGI